MAHEACVKYINLEKSDVVLKYKNKYNFSASTDINEFKNIFPKSYSSPSYIPGTSPEKAVGYTVIVYKKKKKAYLNFAFYYNHLVSVSVSNSYTYITE